MTDLREIYSDPIAELAAAARRLAELGFVASHGGNLSFRVAPGIVLITPTKVPKRLMQPDDIVAIDDAGKTLSAVGDRRPTGETPMHLRLFAKRPDLNALVHAHPPVLTGFALAEDSILERPLLPEPILEIGPILPVAYAEPISDALAAAFDAVVMRSNAWLMKNHGMTLGSSEGIARAVDFLEMAEAMAQSVVVARTLGRAVREIPRAEVENLERTLASRRMPRPGSPTCIHSLIDLYWPETE
jgi:L-fuculose-phosphate aldolase